MSMDLNLVKAAPEAVARIREDPALLDQLLAGRPVEAGLASVVDHSVDVFLGDYLRLGQVFDADQERVAAGQAPRFGWLNRAVHGEGDHIDYDFDYGPAFVLSAERVAAIAEGLRAEGWSKDPEGGYPIDHAIVDFYADASRRGLAVIGGVS